MKERERERVKFCVNISPFITLCPAVQSEISKPVVSQAAAPPAAPPAGADSDSAPRRLSGPPRISAWAGWPAGSSPPPPPPPPSARCRRSAGSGWGWTSSPGWRAERTGEGRAFLQNIIQWCWYDMIWCVADICCRITMITTSPPLQSIFNQNIFTPHQTPHQNTINDLRTQPEPQRVLLINFPRFIVVNNLISPVCRPRQDCIGSDQTN